MAPGAGTRTLRIHPCRLSYVVTQGEFTSCGAEEIEAWCPLERLTGRVSLSWA